MIKIDNPPFKISIEHWDAKITIEKNHSDITWDEYVELLRDISKAAGWDGESIDELFGS